MNVYQGDDVTIHFPPAKDALGNVLDLTGAQLFCSVKRRGTTTAINASSTAIDTPAAEGRSRAVFLPALTGAWVVGATYDYDGVVRLATTELHTVGHGSFVVKDRITPQPT